MDFRKRKKRDRIAAIASIRGGKTRAKAGLPPVKKLPPKFHSTGPLADRLSRAFARNAKSSKGDMATTGAGKHLTFVHARLSGRRPTKLPERFDLIDNSGRRAAFSARKAWADRVALEPPERVNRRNEPQHCKERPQDSRKGKGGAKKRGFVPWCKD